ncbi:neuronal acetylcholine receptor subunit alpha-6-like [Dreissena polymorpha]|uniref:Uncharacterized protein n=1 Tax=Dreissena polymorpha TaxID=45954 RepID=A0A9D4N8D5_DREPO|nr:neuronal acetylcholine receptor subunit alpha-6-like [Dreissena polymorpha]KAH3889793.1 hypothetical protein DPMN_013857 [Dreissena polymorpha]
MKYLVFLAIVGLLPRHVQGRNQSLVDELYKTLLNGQNKNIRPTVNHSYPTEVRVSFELLEILDVDEFMGKLSISGVLIMAWNDHRMRWNPLDYGGVDTIYVSSSETWKPDLVLTEPVEKSISLGHKQTWLKVAYTSDGNATFAPFDVIPSSCNIKITKYPFDSQICELNFHPWLITKHDIVLNTDATQYKEVELQQLWESFANDNAEWRLVGTKSATFLVKNLYSYYRLNLDLIRRPLFVIVNVFIPIYFLSYLNVLSFKLPAIPERVTFAMTILLAFVFFMTTVNDNMPRNSNPIPLICYLLMGNLVISTFNVLMTVFNLYIKDRPDGKTIPRLVAFVSRTKIKAGTPLSTSQWQEVSAKLDRNCLLISKVWLIFSSLVFSGFLVYWIFFT